MAIMTESRTNSNTCPLTPVAPPPVGVLSVAPPPVGVLSGWLVMVYI